MTIINKGIDENGNSILNIDPEANETITLATANTYVDKNIVINIQKKSNSDSDSPSYSEYDDTELRRLIGENTNTISTHQTQSESIITDLNNRIDTKQDILIPGKDIAITSNTISVVPEWHIAEFNTNYFNSMGQVNISAPSGQVIDSVYLLIYWYGNAFAAASNVFGGFYSGKNTDSEKQLIRNNGTNKMGACYITAHIQNMNNNAAIAFGEIYMYNGNGSAASLNNPINSYGIGRYSTTNDFKNFTVHNFPSGLTEAYCCMKYSLKNI